MQAVTVTATATARQIDIAWSAFIPHTPHPRQAVFLAQACREAFFGGAAGGGKSDALLMAALQYVDLPGYSAILFRRTYADLALSNALMNRADEWLRGTGAVWRAKDKVWRFPSGATLTFGYLDNENDKYRYQSAEFQFIGFDELTHFAETQYTYLFSRLRRNAGSPVPLRMRSASNPGGVGHEWVKARFVDGGLGRRERVFVPSRLADNPSIDADKYAQSLAELDPVTRAQQLHGDWDVRSSGNMFKREWFGYVDLDAEQWAETRWVRFWDLAGTAERPGQAAVQAYTAGALVGMRPDGRYVVGDMLRKRLDPGGVQALVLATAERDGPSVAIRQEQEPGSAGKFVVADFAQKLAAYDYRGVPSTGSKEERARPLSAAASNGIVDLVRGQWTGAFLDELEAFPQPGVTRDQVDAASGAYTELTSGPRLQVW